MYFLIEVSLISYLPFLVRIFYDFLFYFRISPEKLQGATARVLSVDVPPSDNTTPSDDKREINASKGHTPVINQSETLQAAPRKKRSAIKSSPAKTEATPKTENMRMQHPISNSKTPLSAFRPIRSGKVKRSLTAEDILKPVFRPKPFRVSYTDTSDSTDSEAHEKRRRNRRKPQTIEKSRSASLYDLLDDSPPLPDNTLMSKTRSFSQELLKGKAHSRNASDTSMWTDIATANQTDSSLDESMRKTKKSSTKLIYVKSSESESEYFDNSFVGGKLSSKKTSFRRTSTPATPAAPGLDDSLYEPSMLSFTSRRSGSPYVHESDSASSMNESQLLSHRDLSGKDSPSIRKILCQPLSREESIVSIGSTTSLLHEPHIVSPPHVTTQEDVLSVTSGGSRTSAGVEGIGGGVGGGTERGKDQPPRPESAMSNSNNRNTAGAIMYYIAEMEDNPTVPDMKEFEIQVVSICNSEFWVPYSSN